MTSPQHNEEQLDLDTHMQIVDALGDYQVDDSVGASGKFIRALDALVLARIARDRQATRTAVVEAALAAIGNDEDIEAPVTVLHNEETTSLVRHDRHIRNILRAELRAQLSTEAVTLNEENEK